MRIKYSAFLLCVLFLSSCSWLSRQADTHFTAMVIKTETGCSSKEAWRIASENAAYNYYEDSYITKKLYLKMPEAEFLKVFKKTPNPKNSKEPYIASYANNEYLVRGAYRHSDKTYEYNARFTFKNGFLKRFEVLDGGYIDAIHRLKEKL